MATTREAWLLDLANLLRPEFEQLGYPLPDKIRVSCGFPSCKALARKNKRIGECWAPAASSDQTSELFMSPVLADGADAAAVLVHELCHAAASVECGHRAPFSTLARKIGLAGKLTATTASDALKERLHGLTENLGPYPHAALNGNGPTKKQSTRQLKVTCLECGCIVRMTAKWLEETGPPTCGCGGTMETA